MRYLVKINDIKEKTNFFESQLDVIRENINKIESLRKIIIWEGNGATSFLESLDSQVINLRDKENTVLECIKFLTTYYDSYGSEYDRLTKKYANTDLGVTNND